MADSLPNFVIASSNRYNDIEPYCSRIYNQDPLFWGSIFPWEFPQDASREEEEFFVRQYFSETEIHVQGGAHGSGNGFRFLKQVWYCIAIFNIEQRVPAVASHWWHQDKNQEYVQDKEMLKAMCNPETEVQTFFDRSDIAMYGEKLLFYVISHIQRTAITHLQKQEAMSKKEEELVRNTIASSEAAKGTSGISSAPNVAEQKTNEEAVQDVKSKEQHMDDANGTAATVQIPNDPFPSFNPGRPRVTHFEHQPPPGLHLQSRTRGYSRGRYFNHRNGSYQHRNTAHPDERNTQYFPPPIYSTVPPPMYNQSRGMFGPSLDFMPPVPQGQTMPTGPPQGHPAFIPHHFGPPVPMQQLMMVAPPPFKACQPPQQHFGPPFKDVSNVPNVGRVISNEPYILKDDDCGNQASNRRNSVNTRGGRTRGFSGTGGKGSRGRMSSFMSTAPPPSTIDDVPSNRQSSHEFGVTSLAGKAQRRNSASEKNWRSTSDRPQIQRYEPHMKENMSHKPGYRFSSYGSMPAPSGSAQPPALERSLEQTSNLNTQTAMPAHIAGIRSDQGPPHSRATPSTNHKNFCTQWFIGEDCIYANKLIVFNVPEKLTQEEILQFFSTFGKVQQIKRVPFKTYYKISPDSSPVFVIFDSHTDARKCLDEKPEFWLGGKPLRVEVAKEFWDPSYRQVWNPSATITKRWVTGTSNYNASQPPEILRRSEGTMLMPSTKVRGSETGVSAQVASTDTTPTHSNATTPRTKANKSQKKKQKSNMLKDPSLKSIDRDLSNPHEAPVNSDAASIVAAVNLKKADKMNTAPDTLKSPLIASPLAKKQQSNSVQREHQTSLDPVLSSTGVAAAQLSGIDDREIKSVCDKIEIKAIISAADTPCESEQNATPTVRRARGQVNVAAPKLSTPSKSDDEPADDSFHSFHTASGSRHSDKDNHRHMGETFDEAGTALGTKRAKDSVSILSASGIEDELSPQATIASPAFESNAQSKQRKKVQVPATLSKAQSTTTTSEHSGRSVSLQQSQRSTSGDDSIIPTTAFQTAPATPAVTVEPEKLKEVEAKDSKIFVKGVQNTDDFEKANLIEVAENKKEQTQNTLPVKKLEKPKGPAQTESLNPFSKKAQRKSKEKRGKGTLKGKPKLDEAFTLEASHETSHRAFSGDATPNKNRITSSGVPSVIELSTQDCPDKTATAPCAGESVGSESLSNSEGLYQQKNEHEAEKAAIDDSATGLIPETSEKRRGLGGLISGFSIFGSGPTASLKETRSDESLTSLKSSLTRANVQDHGQDMPSKDINSEQAIPAPVAEATQSATKDKTTSFKHVSPMVHSETVRESIEGSQDTLKSSLLEQYALDDVGLGISVGSADVTVDSDDKLRRKKQNKAKKKKNSANDSIDSSRQTTPAAEMPGMCGEAIETVSANSSRTADKYPSSSELQSSGLCTLLRKLPSRPTTSRHLVETKRPLWKRARRLGSGKPQGNVIELDSEPDITYFLSQNDSGDESEGQHSASDYMKKEKAFVYLDHDITNATSDEIEECLDKAFEHREANLT